MYTQHVVGKLEVGEGRRKMLGGWSKDIRSGMRSYTRKLTQVYNLVDVHLRSYYLHLREMEQSFCLMEWGSSVKVNI